MFETFGRDKIVIFFKALDGELDKGFELILIGGTAAALAYRVTRATQDIGVINTLEGVKRAYNKAQKKTGIEIPIEQVAVYDAPYEYEDRLKKYKKIRLKKLILKVPEIHDLILMKTVRGYEHDFDVIEEIIKKNKVSKKILEDRIKNEMTHVIGDENKLKLNFEVLLELFE